MSITSVQHVIGVSQGNGDVLTFSAAATAGNVVVVYGFHSYAGCPPSISNSQASTVTTQLSFADPLYGVPVRVYSMNVGTTGTYSTTLSMGCGAFNVIVMEEFAGVNITTPVDTTHYDCNYVTTPTSLSLSTSVVANASARVLALGGPSVYGATSGWTDISDTVDNVYLVQGKIFTSAGTAAPVITTTSTGNSIRGLLFSMLPAISATQVNRTRTVWVGL